MTTKTAQSASPRRGAAPPADEGLQVSTGWAAVTYFALSLLFFFPAFLPDRQIFGTDYLAGSFFFFEFMSERLLAGELPKWVPYVYGGLPLFSNPGSTYYPFRILADFVVPPERILATLFVIQFALAGLGMYLLARELGARRWVALLAGLAFQFTGTILSYVYAGHDGRTIVATFAPLFFFFLHRGIRTGALAPFVGASATIGFGLLSFQIQSNYYLLLGGAIWAVFALVHLEIIRKPPVLGRRALMGLAAIAFGFLLASVNFLPFLGYVPESPRGGDEGRGYEFAVSWSMPPAEITGLAVPEHAGVLEHYRGENPFKLHTEYLGALALILVVLGFFYSRQNRYWWFFLGLGVFFLTISFGGHTPLYRLYYEILPGTKRFRAPSISFFIVVLALISMATITLERLAQLRAERRTPMGGRRGTADQDPLSMAGWVLAAIVGISVVATGIASVAAGPEPRDAAMVAGFGRFTLFAALTAGALWVWLRGRINSAAVALILAVVTVADLWVVGRRFFDTAPPPDVVFAPDDVVRFLQAQPDPFRVWVLPFPAGASYRNHGNYLMRFGIEQAGGEHGNQLQRYNEFAGAGTEVYVDWHNYLQYPVFLDAANIRYIISMVQLDAPMFQEVHRGSALIYENLNALPRAFLVPEVVVTNDPAGALQALRAPDFDPRRTAVVQQPPHLDLPDTPLTGAAEVVEHTPDRVVVRTQADRPALLVLSDNFYEGWRATTANGEELPIVRTNHTFRGVAVPAGEQVVTFEFRPAVLYQGFAIYLVGMAFLLLYGLVLLVRRRRAPAEPESTA